MTAGDAELPWALTACGFTAQFCADPQVFPVFRRWLSRNGWDAAAGHFSPALLEQASDLMGEFMQDVETEMTAREFEALLGEYNGESGLPLTYDEYSLAAGR